MFKDNDLIYLFPKSISSRNKHITDRADKADLAEIIFETKNKI